MSCPRKLFLTQRKSRFSGGSVFSEASACSLASLSDSHVLSPPLHEILLFFQTSDRGWPTCGRLGRQASARTKTSAYLKITFVAITYPIGWTGRLPFCLLIFFWCNIDFCFLELKKRGTKISFHRHSNLVEICDTYSMNVFVRSCIVLKLS